MNHQAQLIEDAASFTLKKDLRGSFLQRAADLISPYPTHEEDWMSLTWSREEQSLRLASWPSERVIEIPFGDITKIFVLSQEPMLFEDLFTIWLHHQERENTRVLRLLLRVKQQEDPLELIWRIARRMNRPSYRELSRSAQHLYLSLEAEQAPTEEAYRAAHSTLIAVPIEERPLVPRSLPKSEPWRTTDLRVHEWLPGERVSFSFASAEITDGWATETFIFDLAARQLAVHDTVQKNVAGRIEITRDRGTRKHELAALSELYLQRDSSTDVKGTQHRALILLRHMELFCTRWGGRSPKLTAAQAFEKAHPLIEPLSAALGLPWMTNLGTAYGALTFGYTLPDGTAVFLQDETLIARHADRRIKQSRLGSSFESYHKDPPRVMGDGALQMTLRDSRGTPYKVVTTWRPRGGLQEIWRGPYEMDAVMNDRGTILLSDKRGLQRKQATDEQPRPCKESVAAEKIERLYANSESFYLLMRGGSLRASTDDGDTWQEVCTLPKFKEGFSEVLPRLFMVEGALWFVSPDEIYRAHGITLKAPKNIHLMGITIYHGYSIVIAREGTMKDPKDGTERDTSSLVLFRLRGDSLERLSPVRFYEVGARPARVVEDAPPEIDELYLQRPHHRMRFSGFKLYSAFSQPDGIYLTGENGVDQFAFHHSGGTILCIPRWELDEALG